MDSFDELVGGATERIYFMSWSTRNFVDLVPYSIEVEAEAEAGDIVLMLVRYLIWTVRVLRMGC